MAKHLDRDPNCYEPEESDGPDDDPPELKLIQNTDLNSDANPRPKQAKGMAIVIICDNPRCCFILRGS